MFKGDPSRRPESLRPALLLCPNTDGGKHVGIKIQADILWIHKLKDIKKEYRRTPTLLTLNLILWKTHCKDNHFYNAYNSYKQKTTILQLFLISIDYFSPQNSNFVQV